MFRIGPDFYVGSTTVPVQKRQDSRLRKLRQLLDFKPVHAELMLHWQVSHHCLGSLIAIPLATMNTSRQIRTLESTLIQKWNPTLNYPFILKKRITKLGPDYSRSVRQIASSYSAQAIDCTESSVQDCTRWEHCPCTARKNKKCIHPG